MTELRHHHENADESDSPGDAIRGRLGGIRLWGLLDGVGHIMMGIAVDDNAARNVSGFQGMAAISAPENGQNDECYTDKIEAPSHDRHPYDRFRDRIMSHLSVNSQFGLHQ